MDAPKRDEEIKVERTDVNVRMIAKFAIALIIVAAFVHVLILGVFKLFEIRSANNDPKLSPLTPTKQIAPEPRLQAMQQPAKDGKELPFDPQLLRQNLLDQEEKQLNSYGWVNGEQGIVHIPIQEAKKLIAERGIPATQPQAQTQPQTQGAQ